MKRLVLIAAVTAVIGAWPAASSAATRTGAAVAKHRSALIVAFPARAHTARIRGVVVRRADKTVLLPGNHHLVVQATISAVGPGTVTLTVGTQMLTLSLPLGLTLPASLVGQTVTLSVPIDDRNNADEDRGDDHDRGDGHSGHGRGGSDG